MVRDFSRAIFFVNSTTFKGISVFSIIIFYGNNTLRINTAILILSSEETI
jgi:hypothetical protein